MEQNKVLATAIQPVGRQMHLLRRRQMDEAHAGKRLRSQFAVVLGGRPVVGGTQVYQHRRRLIHTAILLRRPNGQG